MVKHMAKIKSKFVLGAKEHLKNLKSLKIINKHDLPVGLHQKVVSVGSLWQCLAGIRTEYAKTVVDSEPRSALF